MFADGPRTRARELSCAGNRVAKQYDTDCQDIFTGGLDTTNDADGEFTYYWRDDVTQIVFHIATMMPAGDPETGWVNKKRHIGNDYVTIVFNDSTRDFAFGTT